MEYKHILVALELSEESNILIDRAVFLATKLNAQLSFIHIDGTHGEIYPELIDLQSDNNESPLNKHTVEQLKTFESQTEYPIKHLLVGTGNLSDKLHSAIQDHGVALLICGHHHDFWSSIVSYSKHLIDKSPVDILIVPV